MKFLFKFINLFFYIYKTFFFILYKISHINFYIYKTFFYYIIFLLKFKMTYNSIEEIEAVYPEPENKTKAERTKRLRNMNQAKKRLIIRQQKAFQVAGGSSTATS